MSKDIEDRLRFITLNVNDWLKFAEAKNGALMAANSAVIFGALSLANGKKFLFPIAEYYFYFFIGLLSLSGLVCLISFLPKLELPNLLSLSLPKDKSNLVFFGDISGYDPAVYVRAIHYKKSGAKENIDPFEEDLAEQAIINSRIALNKYHMFNIALWLDVSAFLTPIISILVYYFLVKKGE